MNTHVMLWAREGSPWELRETDVKGVYVLHFGKGLDRVSIFMDKKVFEGLRDRFNKEDSNAEVAD